MDTVIGVVLLVAIVLAVRKAWRDAMEAPGRSPGRTPPRTAGDATERERQRDGAFFDGLLIGGYLMHRHHTDDDRDDQRFDEDGDAAFHDDSVDDLDSFDDFDDFDDGFGGW